MPFNSFGFILAFLPVTLVGFFVLGRWHHRWAALWLVAASTGFYAAWRLPDTLLLIGSIGFNFAAGSAISKAGAGPSGRAVFAAAVAANLGVLGVFKYWDFLASVTGMPKVGLVLPLGISFFSITQIAYLADARAGLAQERDLLRYTLFVTFFPHLVAGPIVHHAQLMPQFALPSVYQLNLANLARGVALFTFGLAKKVLVADRLALLADPAFEAAMVGGTPGLVQAWTGLLAFTFQIYFDFSGYSDMAVGLARMFGIELPVNFDRPYRALNLVDFWRRWHITLSAFLRDYLFFPLGANRRGELRGYANLIATMAIAGLWHGANWTFLLWGTLHGVLLAATHAWLRAKRLMWRREPLRVGRGVASVLTFAVVTLMWAPFRAGSWDPCANLLLAMAGQRADGSPFVPNRTQFVTLAGSAVLATIGPAASRLVDDWSVDTGWRGPALASIAGLLLASCILSLRETTQFVYFQF